MKCLVTGGAGFIGSQLAKRLISEGHEVHIVDNLSTGSRGNLPPEASFVEADLSAPDFTKRLPQERFDAVCHLAAQSSGPASIENPLYDIQINALSTLALSRWCLARNIPRFLYASSMAVYGDTKDLPVSENRACAPLSYYGAAKLASEQFLALAALEGLSATSFR